MPPQFRSAGLASLVCALAAQLNAQSQEWVESARPVADAVNRLVADCRCVITYEDPRWEEADVEDATERVSRVQAPARRIYVPKTVGFVFLYEKPERASGPQDMRPAVETMLTWHEYAGPRLGFTFESTADGVHVFPKRGSVLDVRMSVPAQEGRASDMLMSFLAELKKTAGVEIVPGVVPMGYLATSKGQLGATKEPARRVLARLLSSAGRKVTWQLNYDYTLRFYVLNLAFADPAHCDTVGAGLPCDLGDTDKAVPLQPRH